MSKQPDAGKNPGIFRGSVSSRGERFRGASVASSCRILEGEIVVEQFLLLKLTKGALFLRFRIVILKRGWGGNRIRPQKRNDKNRFYWIVDLLTHDSS
ncbi:hypothetical protein CEXT_733261 [Caerostris extrusa]|uniref:Uncharacterized protein n=1 Tax=Caerostris extrusa TaxID=172846 RepID=A0AAV4R1W0_CAEEX|nr:hypothetical protein CEXT_733261 [Caerostris extrusa]